MAALLRISLSLFVLLEVLNVVKSCNKAICGAVVSKCMLMQSCKCERKAACVCCKDCMHCLGHLYADCCSCVDLCQEKNPSETDIGIETHSERFDKADPALFDTIMQDDDALDRWHVKRTEEKWSQAETEQWEMKFGETVSDSFGSLQAVKYDKSGLKKVNCTVAYLPDCMSLAKCLDICRGLGSSGYQYFPDGCCECFGSMCKNNGIDQSQCRKCPGEDEPDFEEEDLYIHRNLEEQQAETNVEKDSVSQSEMQNDISAA